MLKKFVNIRYNDNIAFGIIFFILYKENQNKNLFKDYKSKYALD